MSQGFVAVRLPTLAPKPWLPNTHNHSLVRKILVLIKNHPSSLLITEGRYTPYLNSRYNMQGGNVLIYLDSRTPCEWVKEFLPLLESSGYIPHVPHPITFQVTHLPVHLSINLSIYLFIFISIYL